MKRLVMFVAFFVCMDLHLIMAQTVQITGTIRGAEDEQPLPGASIMVKGTHMGTTTDFQGKYTLSVPFDAKILVVDFMGMKTQEIAIGGRSVVDVAMFPEAIGLNEVVVTALGIKRERKALGYAAEDVSGEDLQRAGNTSLAGALEGKVSGVTVTPSSGMPGASAQIMIRGARSFTGDNTPLYVIDGMPVASSIDKASGDKILQDGITGADYANRAIDIDPSDIESLTVLKGQAAAALYGIRASNGVIAITTKSGKGNIKGKPVVTLSTNNNVDIISRYPDVQTTYAQGSGGVYKPTASTSWGPKIADLPQDANYGGETNNQYTQLYGLQPGKYYVPQRANTGLDPWTTPQVYDNIREFFSVGYSTSTMLNLSQAMDKTNYSISLSGMNQTGIIRSTGMHRYSAKATAETQLDNRWKTGFTANYIRSFIRKTTGANDGIVATVYPAPPSYDLKGIPSSYADDPYAQVIYRSLTFDNPYWSLDNNSFTEGTNRFFGNGYIDFSTDLGDKSKNLDIRYQLGADSYATLYETIWGYGHVGGLGSAENETYQKTVINSLLTANYTWKINDDWDFGTLFGNEFNDERIKDLDAIGQTFNFPGWNNINNTVIKSNAISQLGNRTVGFFGNVSASWKNMLYLNATGRNDYVSSMPRGNRSFFYPSVSLGFILTELDVLKNIPIFSFAKLRVSYAQVGQAGVYRQNYYSIPTYNGGYWGGTPIVYPINSVNAFTASSKIYDSNLKPQNTDSYEFGTDIKLLDNLFGLGYTFSRQDVTDQIFSVPLAGSTGAEYLVTNGGKIHTNTHEITLSVNPVRQKNVNWEFAINWTKMDNYVDKLATGVGSIFLGGFEVPQVRAQIGEKFPIIYGVSYSRDEEGHLLVGSDGLPIAGGNDVIGKVAPDFLLDFSTSLRLWKCTINAVVSWKNGGQMYGGTNGLLDYYGISKNTRNRDDIVVDGYYEDGTKNTTQVALQSYYAAINAIDEASIFDASFVKLRELTVSYQLPKIYHVDLSITLYARNILVWTNYPNFDPESSQGNTNMSGAFERFSLPQTSTLGLGLNVTF